MEFEDICELPKLKKALLLQQDPFTRTLYENEKITF
jgi:hypothetical protein